ncbi:MAG TPA: ABC transporter ATP-binding protein [Candidatus Desulfaltia sp.]|nr:ABC transporter ATP-binding protein [Candidatus Desulfaltia sp.]
MIRISKLSKIYATAKVRVVALQDVTLSLEDGVFAAVTGASGSGKSTFLNLLGGLDTPTAGMIEVGGRKISEMNREELALYRRSGVGMIFQSFNLIPGRDALENVALPLIFAGIPKRERRKRSAEMLARVGLGERMRHRPSELSGGEQQRVAIARALINNPRVLLADEPTGNLDSRTAREIITLLAGLNRDQGLTVVLVTHEEALAGEFAHRGVRLHDGRVETQEKWR